jgi:predicted nucleotidyltransferase
MRYEYGGTRTILGIPIIERRGLTEGITFYPLIPMEKILEVKRKAATKVCSQILERDSKVEIITLLGSVAHGDIIGWFSDIDMLVITNEPKKDEMIEVDHQVLFIEYPNWKSFEDLIVKKIARDEYEDRSSYLFFYGNPHYLHSSEKGRVKYSQIIKLGIEALWKDYSEINEYLDDFVWFYGSAKEALKYNQLLTAMGKLQHGIILLLRYYLIKNKILLRKPLPDQRTIIQLRNSPVPKKLINFVETFYQAKLDMDTTLQLGKEMYLQVTNERKWLNKIPI